jgi:hypothetical protein
MLCAYCEVGTKVLNIIRTNSTLQRVNPYVTKNLEKQTLYHMYSKQYCFGFFIAFSDRMMAEIR